jgi:hypothetical protein
VRFEEFPVVEQVNAVEVEFFLERDVHGGNLTSDE